MIDFDQPGDIQNMQNVPPRELMRQSKIILLHYYIGTLSIIGPKMSKLNKIVVSKTKAYWKDVAYNSLDYDLYAVQAIDEQYRGNPHQCCQALFEKWLSTSRVGESKTWEALLRQLREVDELAAAVEEISEELIHDPQIA